MTSCPVFFDSLPFLRPTLEEWPPEKSPDRKTKALIRDLSLSVELWRGGGPVFLTDPHLEDGGLFRVDVAILEDSSFSSSSVETSSSTSQSSTTRNSPSNPQTVLVCIHQQPQQPQQPRLYVLVPKTFLGLELVEASGSKPLSVLMHFESGDLRFLVGSNDRSDTKRLRHLADNLSSAMRSRPHCRRLQQPDALSGAMSVSSPSDTDAPTRANQDSTTTATPTARPMDQNNNDDNDDDTIPPTTKKQKRQSLERSWAASQSLDAILQMPVGMMESPKDLLENAVTTACEELAASYLPEQELAKCLGTADAQSLAAQRELEDILSAAFRTPRQRRSPSKKSTTRSSNNNNNNNLHEAMLQTKKALEQLNKIDQERRSLVFLPQRDSS